MCPCKALFEPEDAALIDHPALPVISAMVDADGSLVLTTVSYDAFDSIAVSDVVGETCFPGLPRKRSAPGPMQVTGAEFTLELELQDGSTAALTGGPRRMPAAVVWPVSSTQSTRSWNRPR